MTRLTALLVILAVPAGALAQNVAPPPGAPPPPLVAPPPPSEVPPPPPSYPPLAPAPVQPNLAPSNLQPYQPIFVQPAPATAAESQREFGLAAGEFFASAAVTLAATLAVNSALGPSQTASDQATAQIVALLYIGLVPALTSLPVWVIGMFSDRYDPHLGPAIEAGSAVSGIAVLMYIIADGADPTGDSTKTWKYAAGGLLVIGMPLAEVIALNVTKTPKGGGVPYAGPPILPELPERHADLGIPVAGTMVFGLPAISF